MPRGFFYYLTVQINSGLIYNEFYWSYIRMIEKRYKRTNPYLTIIGSFAAIIAVGCLLLMLPFASSSGKSIGIINSLFMATSAVCVTGLSVVTVGVDFTVFGKVVMAALMEVGGLSFITIAVFFFTMLGAKIGITDSFMIRESLNQSSVKGLVPLVRKIVGISLSVQFLGTVINAFEFNKIYGSVPKAMGVSLFHSIASFNNAGFDVFGPDSMIPFRDNAVINITTMSMIFIGSLGFIVWDDIYRKKKWKKLKLHSKIVLVTTACLVIGGALIIKLTLRDPDFTWLQAAFASITCRTAGFTTYDLSALKDYPAAYLVFVFLMIIGASPCSTGGGIKTTTLAVVVLVLISYAKGQSTRVFKRRIGDSQIFKAFVLIGLCVAVVGTGTFLVSAIQPDIILAGGEKAGFAEILFEVASAFSTTGLSMGITSALNGANRVLLCLIMFCGRLGPLTIIGVVNKNWMSESKESIQYVEENVIIG